MHLSYECPQNLLGPRERPPPPPKKGRRVSGGCSGVRRGRNYERDLEEEEEEERESELEKENWASVVDGERGSTGHGEREGRGEKGEEEGLL